MQIKTQFFTIIHKLAWVLVQQVSTEFFFFFLQTNAFKTITPLRCRIMLQTEITTLL